MSLAGAVDVHVHTAPDVVERRYTDIEAAGRAAAAGMAAIVLKCHHESTVGRAAAAAEATGFEVHGGLVLNRGIDPKAVDAALRLGARVIWWPTVVSAAHRTYYERVPTPEPRVDADAVAAICKLIAAHGAVLATGHAGRETVWALAEAAEAADATLLVTHADFWIPDLEPEEQARLARAHAGVWFERCAYVCAPGTPDPRPVERIVAGIRATGAERTVLSSDLGQPQLPDYPEGIAWFAAALADAGVEPADVRAMLTEQPRRMLGPPRPSGRAGR
jgi:Family of unknown function (DUF6282)